MSSGGQAHYRAGSAEFQIAIVQRIAKVEADMAALQNGHREQREFLEEKIDEVVQAQARDVHEIKANQTAMKNELVASISSTNSKIETTNALLNSINNKLSIHAFIFAMMSAIGLTALAAFAKSVFDAVMGKN